MSALALLRQQLAEVIDGARPPAPGLPSGIPALDALLVGGGLPRGKLTELVGPAGQGKTTVARAMALAAADAGHWVAWIDATRTCAPRDLAPLGDHDGTWVIRPGDPARASWAADILLRAGAFGLVILDRAPLLPRAVAVRLGLLARESDAVLLALADGDSASQVPGALKLRVTRGAARRLSLTLEKGGPVGKRVELATALPAPRHLAVREPVPDRRGVHDAARRGRAPRAGSPRGYAR